MNNNILVSDLAGLEMTSLDLSQVKREDLHRIAMACLNEQRNRYSDQSPVSITPKFQGLTSERVGMVAH
jgi:hypothetical protein